MKKILKFIIVILSINFVVVFGSAANLMFKVFSSSMNDSNLSISDLFTLNKDPSKLKSFEDTILSNSSKKGTEYAHKFESLLSIFIPVNNIKGTSIPDNYSFKDVHNGTLDKVTSDGISNAFKILDESNKKYDEIRNNSLK